MKRQLYFLAFIFLSATGCADRPMPARTEPELEAPNIDLFLNEPARNVKGLTWNNFHDDELFAVREDPCQVTIHFPSGRVFRSWSKVTFINEKAGVISGVELTPFPELLHFGNARKELENIARELNIHDQRYVHERFQNWRASVPSFSASTGSIVEYHVHVFMALKPHSDRALWYADLEVSYLDEREWELMKDADPEIWQRLTDDANRPNRVEPKELIP